MTTNLKNKIEEVLDEWGYSTLKNRDFISNKILTEISEAIKGCLPKKHIKLENINRPSKLLSFGWNKYREELKTNLKNKGIKL